jgi:hypothetical protein
MFDERNRSYDQHLPSSGRVPRRGSAERPSAFHGVPPADLLSMAAAVLEEVHPGEAADRVSADASMPNTIETTPPVEAVTPDASRLRTGAGRRGGSLPAVSTSRLVQEAAALAADGEIGNSDAIRLLQIAHTSGELKHVLHAFDACLTREARSKLALAAYAPLPAGVQNQRFEPIFDRYPLSGRTYTTARGAVVLNEVQYYNGEMVQIYGECRNVRLVREALAGSGYTPLILRYDDGRETVVSQFWAHQLTDTSIGPYNAMFLIVAAVPEHAAAEESSIRADDNGASSILSMLDGDCDAAGGTYTNRARLYYVRLLDSTQVAIDFGRERMGTDKRPGTIYRARSGSRLVFAVRDGFGHTVARIEATLTSDPDACGSAIAQAAHTAGLALPRLARGTERIYPGAARIGQAPVVCWDWRTDVMPRLQPAAAATLVVDASSEEGSLLAAWHFVPKILGHLPNVRGAVTGVPDTPPSAGGKVTGRSGSA